MAEAYLNNLAGDRFFAESAGIEPGALNPLVVESMKQDGVDISGNSTKSVFDLYRQGRAFDCVITVCDREAAERCPVFIGATKRLQWSFKDPSKFAGSEAEKLAHVSEVRYAIKMKIIGFIREYAG
jgi:arsenate reductase